MENEDNITEDFNQERLKKILDTLDNFMDSSEFVEEFRNKVGIYGDFKDLVKLYDFKDDSDWTFDIAEEDFVLEMKYKNPDQIESEKYEICMEFNPFNGFITYRWLNKNSIGPSEMCLASSAMNLLKFDEASLRDGVNALCKQVELCSAVFRYAIPDQNALDFFISRAYEVTMLYCELGLIPAISESKDCGEDEES